MSVERPIVELIEPEQTAIVPPWLGEKVRVNWPLNDLPRAELEAILGYGWGVQIGSDENGPIIETIKDHIKDNWEVRIRTTSGELPAEEDAVLFRGYLDAIERGANESGHKATLHLVGLGEILRTEHVVQGQWWLDKGEEAHLITDPMALVRARMLPALDCVFNAGMRNCRMPVRVTADRRFRVGWPHQGGYYLMPLFTHFADPNGMYWNWARIFAYLLALPGIHFNPPTTPWIGPLSRLEFCEFPVELNPAQAGMDGMTLIERIHYPQGDKCYATMNPESDAPPSDPWGMILCDRPHKRAAEGMTWLDALHWACICTGIAYHWLNTIEVVGQPPNQTVTYKTGLRFLLPQAARATTLRLASPAFKTHDKTWAEVEAHANVTQLDWREDYGRIVNSGRAVGAPWATEITISLVPGWPQNSDWDVDPTDAEAVAAALAAIYPASPWHAKYDRNGSQVLSAQTGRVGRTWGVNTWGQWTAYGRWKLVGQEHVPFGPWQAAQYAVFDLADVRMSTWDPAHVPPAYKRDENAPRPRVWQPCLTGWTPQDPWAPLIEISFDEGQHWRPLEGTHLATRDLRIVLTTEDLTSITQTVAAWPNAAMNLPEAYIKGLLRIRVTAQIESDAATAFDTDDLVGPPPFFSPSLRRRRHLLERRSDWMIRKRDDAVFGNSQFNRVLNPGAPNYPSRVRDDEDSMWADLSRLRYVQDRVRSAGPVTLPGLVYPVMSGGALVAGYRPGDSVSKLDAAGADPADEKQALCEITLGGNETETGAVIAAVRWDSGREPPVAMTTLSLEDPSRFIELTGARDRA